jgi:glycosyltransferase involved in cell wall biosynthesis
VLFSVIIPITDDNVHLLPFTLESIAEQIFDSFEIIIIDGRAKGDSLSIYDANRYRLKRVYIALDRNLSAMWNKGVDLSQGKYLHFMQPGEFYISRNTFRFLKEFIEKNPSVDLIYTGRIIRHSLSMPQQFFKQIEKIDLKGARVPQDGLQAYWFKKDTLLFLNKFDTRYRIQGGFDLICRLFQKPNLQKIFMPRILTDYEYRLPRPKWIIQQLIETLFIIFRRFGLGKAAFFWIAQNHLRFICWWSKSIKQAFWKKHSA